MSDTSLLRHADFRLLLAGQTATQLGSQVGSVAIPLLAIEQLQATALQVGVLGAASTIAFAVLGLPAGAWIDRTRVAPILVASDVARAVLLASIPVAAWLGLLTISQLVVVAALTGVARVFFDIGYQSYVPHLVGRDRVLAGNSALELVRSSGQVAGPGLGGVLVTIAGAADVLLIQAATFAASTATLLAIRTPEPRPTRPARRTTLRAEILEGLRVVRRNRVLRTLALASALGNLTFAIASAVTMIFLVRTLDLPAWTVGFVVAAASVAAMAGAAWTPGLSRAVGSVRIIWLSLAVTSPFTLLGAAARPGWGVALVVAGMAMGELGQIVYAVTSVSLRQRLCPPGLLGRVNATMRVLIMGLFPLGAVVGGVLGELVGVRATLVVAGLVGMVAPTVLLPVLRAHRDVEDLPAWD
jgi:MFS family permease